MEFKGKRDLIKTVQNKLNLEADGIAGKNTWSAISSNIGSNNTIKDVQTKLGLSADGIDGSDTWNAIINKISTSNVVKPLIIETTSKPTISNSLTLSDKSLKLILDYEVGGGAGYYNKALKHPCYPGGASGVTIGIGYDLGYNSSDQFRTDWRSLLDGETFNRLAACLGSKGSFAKILIPNVKDIEINWDIALIVFKNNTLPRFMKETLKAFPEADKLHPDAFGALVSLVFNRGAAVTGTNRTEMMNIRNLVPSKNYKAIAQEIINMKRIWVGKGLDGLLRRRDEEAALIKSCV